MVRICSKFAGAAGAVSAVGAAIVIHISTSMRSRKVTWSHSFGVLAKHDVYDGQFASTRSSMTSGTRSILCACCTISFGMCTWAPRTIATTRPADITMASAHAAQKGEIWSGFFKGMPEFLLSNHIRVDWGIEFHLRPVCRLRSPAVSCS